jgi:choline dehydrogenase-like flavoprotein
VLNERSITAKFPNTSVAVKLKEKAQMRNANITNARFLKEHAVGAHHFTGAWSTMPCELGGVMEPLLPVYGTANLRVCDASIFPLTLRANPQANRVCLRGAWG